MSDDLYRIKPLVWRRDTRDEGVWFAIPPTDGWKGAMMVRTADDIVCWGWLTQAGTGSLSEGNAPTESEAKAAAEAWYRARIAEALEPVDQSEQSTNLHAVGRFLEDFSKADLDDSAADAVTVGMVYQSEAAALAKRCMSALPEPATPEASKTNAVAAETGPEPASLSAEVARLREALDRARALLRTISLERRVIGPIATQAQTMAWQISEVLDPSRATPEASKTNAVAAETGPEPASLSAEVARLREALNEGAFFLSNLHGADLSIEQNRIAVQKNARKVALRLYVALEEDATC